MLGLTSKGGANPQVEVLAAAILAVAVDPKRSKKRFDELVAARDEAQERIVAAQQILDANQERFALAARQHEEASAKHAEALRLKREADDTQSGLAEREAMLIDGETALDAQIDEFYKNTKALAAERKMAEHQAAQRNAALDQRAAILDKRDAALRNDQFDLDRRLAMLREAAK